MQESDMYHFSLARVVFILFLLTTAVQSSRSSTELASTVMFDPIVDETTVAMLFTITPTSSTDDSLAREMVNNAVAMIFRNTDINKFEDIRGDFLTTIATAITSQCANIDCGTRNHVTYTSDHVGILPGYPIQDGSDVVVVFSVVLPQEAVPSHNGEVLEQTTLLVLATAAVDNVRTETGLDVREVRVYGTPATSSDDEDEANIVLILSLMLIPFGVIVLVAVVGCLLMWKKSKNYHRSYYFSEVTKPGVEMVSYTNTDNE